MRHEADAPMNLNYAGKHPLRISPPQLLALLLLALIALPLMTFSQVQDFEFVSLDDPVYVVNNPHVRNGLTFEGVLWAFTTTHASFWHPLTWLSHMLDAEIYGLNPKGHHLNNLLLHMANTIVLFLVLKRMTGAIWRSAFVAALFAIHPLHVESVAWVSERKDVLSTLFWMFTLGAYVRYVERPSVRRYFPVVFFFILGLMAKPMLVTLPFVLLLLDYWPLRRLQSGGTPGGHNLPTLLLEKIPLLIPVIPLSILAYTAQQDTGALATFEALPLSLRAANALLTYGRYLLKALWPVNLSCFYPHPYHALFFWQSGALLVVFVLLFRSAYRLRQKYPYVITGLCWYFGVLVPVIGIVQVGAHAMADRYTYIPLVGPFIIAAWGVPDLAKRWHRLRRLPLFFGIFSIGFFSVLAAFQSAHWKNSVSLFKHALAADPGSHILHFHMGGALQEAGQIDSALHHFSQVLRLKPDFWAVHYPMANLLSQLGEFDRALSHYHLALQGDSEDFRAHNNLGLLLLRHGKTDEALWHFRQALRINPRDRIARHNVGVAVRRLGLSQEP
ncbi:MAG: tetratricopeptide repeat protein [Thermodesulfobacteriota bacterium]